ncbi:extracellular solute-binding protein [Virgibacillus halodenitrificans]|uniref:ABC transporter substrate-binding protein n=1 Tax=Virgibacillus halodenitrificans TaxID=1482 RepID=UPI0013686D45|nr:ABC transporter substrate-binding protein [Virgibacillus halodenitrificans]MYL45160.1 extracellular solute-binding protein [Virgibacillus halodenitrificans]WHX26363.1 ABC transporter substrate-binding protein [Virgibacillus halodenitrificans]
MRKIGIVALLAVLMIVISACGSKEEEASGEAKTLTVYSPHQNEIINPIVKEFQDRTGVNVDVVTGGTGELLNRVTAEEGNPGGDVFWGGGAESLEAYGESFEPYVTSEDDAIAADFKSPENVWTGFSALPMVIMYNQEMVEEENAPKAWKDLLNEQWTGKIAYVDPGKSGSAYTQLVTMLTAYEDDGSDGWGFVEDFVANLDGTILSSSSAVPKGVADGEFPVGITLEEAAFRYIAGGASVDVNYPEEGTSAVPDGVALIKDAKNNENAKKFIDFLVSEDVQKMIVEDFSRRSIRSDVNPPEGLIASDDIPLVDYDFGWSAENKDEVMDKFQKILISQ